MLAKDAFLIMLAHARVIMIDLAAVDHADTLSLQKRWIIKT